MFDSESAKIAGSKSKRKRDNLRTTLRNHLGLILEHDLHPDNLSKVLSKTSPGMRLKFYADVLKFILPTAESDEININALSKQNIDDLIERIKNGS